MVLSIGSWDAGPRKYGGSHIVVMSASGNINTSGSLAAIMDLSLPVKLYSTILSPFGLPYYENMGLAAGISLPSCLHAEI